MKKLFLVLIASGSMMTTFAQDKNVKNVAPVATPAVQAVPAAVQATPAAQPADNPNAPVLKFKIEKHDFGTVPEGPAAVFEFEFTNEGKEPLILSNVQASCGCTTPTWPKEPVLPGKSSTIKASYNTQGRPGPFTKSITVTSNAKTPSTVLMINGTVEKAPATTAPEKAPATISVPDHK